MQRSLALLTVSALLPIVILGAVVGTFGFHNQRTAIERQAQDHAHFMATLIGRELVTTVHRAEMIAQSPTLDQGIDEKRFTALALRLLAIEPLWRIISVASPQGMRLLDVPVPIAGIPRGRVLELDSFRGAVATRKPIVSRIVIAPRGTGAFAVRAPVIRNGRLVYIVSTVIEPKAMRRLLLDANLPPRWRIEVIDQIGNIVAQTGTAQVFGGAASRDALSARRGPPGVMYRDNTAAGMDEMATWQPIPQSRWTVHVAMPTSDYRAPILRASGVLIAGLLASIGLAAALVALIARDMSAQRRRTAAATESQRMEALGRMTGGVAHDFNNLLTPVIAGLDMLQRRLNGDPKGLRLAEAALESAERARTLVSRLLAFSRRQALRPRDIDIVALLAGMRDLIERSIGKGVQLRYELPQTALSARVDPAQLELAILNLAVNADDVMPEGGRLTISVTPETTVAAAEGLAAGDYVKIAVADTGAGMDAATAAQAIEPFFTTKPIGKGTGLGLSMVHGLAAQSGGTLRLISAPGAGTTVEIWLPLGAAPEVPDKPATPMIDDRTARIMLVDDNVRVRHATAELLREHGHVVIEAAAGTEALAILAEDRTFDAIVTDFVMPGLSGAELAHGVRSLLPGIPILLITGFADLTDGLPPNVDRLGKPFRAAELLAHVSAMLKPRHD